MIHHLIPEVQKSVAAEQKEEFKHNPQVRPEEGFAKVDADWLSSKLA